MPMLVEASWGYLSYESGVWQALPEPHLRVHSHGYFNTAFSWGLCDKCIAFGNAVQSRHCSVYANLLRKGTQIQKKYQNKFGKNALGGNGT